MGSIGYGNYWLNPAILPIELAKKTLHMLKSNDFEWFNTTYGNIPHRSYGNIPQIFPVDVMGNISRAIVPIELTEKWIHMLKGNVLIPQK